MARTAGVAVWLVSVSCLVLTLGRGAGRQGPGLVYGVTALQVRIAARPAAWLGRTVQVAGRLVAVSKRDAPKDNRGGYLELEDLGRPEGTPGLRLAWGGVDPLLRWVRRLPVLGPLAPRPQTPRWQGMATYRVRIQAVPGSGCPFPLCDEAMVLDAAP